jgi:MFS family permease
VNPTRSAAAALAVTLAIQIFTSLAATATAVLAPIIAADLSLPPKLIGVFVGVLYTGSMAGSLASGGFIERFGAIRVSQVCVLFCAAGVATVAAGAAPSAMHVALLTIAPLMIGLGYGPITPASSHVLVQTAPPSRMGLTFSIKQTGVPVGAALAGAALPGIALTLGWRETFVGVAALGVAIAVLSEPMRASLDRDRMPMRKLSIGGVFTPLKRVFATPALIEMALAGFIYAAMQICLGSFLVVYLTETLHMSLIAAGLALTVANIGGICGRIGWGAVADHYVRPRTLLGVIGVASGACAYGAAAFGTGWSAAAVLVVCGLFGVTAIGWNGVQLAEIARQAPDGQAGTTTGATSFVTFAGVVVGPPTFALLAAVTGSYRVGFGVFGTLSLLYGLWLLSKHRR